VSVDLTTDVEQAKESSPRHYAHFGFRFVTPLALGSTLNPVNSTALVALSQETITRASLRPDGSSRASI
jgi:hypothetical protein